MLRRADRDRRAVKVALKAARDRRYRQRRHLHVMLAEVEIEETGLDWLVRHQYLDPASSSTRTAAEPTHCQRSGVQAFADQLTA